MEHIMDEKTLESKNHGAVFSGKTASLIILGLSIILLTFLTHDEITLSGNESSRLAMVESVGDRSVFNIDDSRFKTVDRAFIDGKFYCDKPMLYPLYLYAVYSCGKWLGFSFQDTYHDTIFLLNWFGSSLFAVFILILLGARLRGSGATPGMAALLGAAGIFSTWLFSYGGIVNNHVPAALFLLLLFLVIDSWHKREADLKLCIAGLCAGILIDLDIPIGFFFTSACGLYLLVQKKKLIKNLAVFGASFAVPVLFIALVNWWIYGNVLPLYMVPGAYDFSGNIHSTNVAGLRNAKSLFAFAVYLYHISIANHGFFSYMPAMLFIFPAMFKKLRNREAGPALYFIFTVFVCFVFYALATGDYAGWAYGFRYMLPVIPLLWVFIAEWICSSAVLWKRILFWILVSIGIFTSLVGAYNPWTMCRFQTGILMNTFKLNLYCAAYEYGNFTVLERAARPLMKGIKIEQYLPRAFANMRKVDYDGMNTWPLIIKPRETVNMQLLKGLLPYGNGIAMMFLGALFLWLLVLVSLRLLPFILGRKQLLISPARALVLVLPLLLFQTIMIVGFCGITGLGLWSLPLLVCAAIWFGIVCLFTKKPEIVWRMPDIKRNRKRLIIWSIPAFFGLIAVAGFMQLPPLSYDVLTYHLYIPARWLQENSFIHVPTVFSDNSAAFSPKNWYLLAVAWLNFLPGDSVMEAVTLVFLLFAAAAVSVLIAECGGNRKAAIAGAGFTILCPVLFEYSLYAQSDVACAGLLIAGLYWLVRAWHDKQESAFMGALCLGLAVGMKTAMVPFVVLPGILLFAGELRRKRFLSAGVVVIAFLASGGVWYIGNWVLYGNPLFPAAMEIGGNSIFPGAYNSSAVYKSVFHARSVTDLVKTIYSVYGPVLFVILVCGILSWPLAVWKMPQRRKTLILVGSHCFVWLMIYLVVIPHNMQTRFLFPCLLTAISGLVLVVSRFLFAVSFTGGLLALSYIANAVSRQKLYSEGISIYTLEVVLMIGSIMFLSFFAMRKDIVRWQRVVACFAVVWLMVAVFTGTDLVSRKSRGKFYQRLTGFEAAEAFNRPDQQCPANVAYSGFNRPYILMGPDFMNRVTYCNVQGNQTDGFYQFWRKDPKLYPTYKPNIYRNAPVLENWLANLKDQNIQYLVLSRMTPAERTYLPGTPDGFPLPESQWIRGEKNTFQIVYRSQSFIVYRVNTK